MVVCSWESDLGVFFKFVFLFFLCYVTCFASMEYESGIIKD